MTVAVVLLSIPLTAEFVFAPINLWTGRTMATFARFTGHGPRAATYIVAPLELASATCCG